jgi:hypothetical protein
MWDTGHLGSRRASPPRIQAALTTQHCHFGGGSGLHHSLGEAWHMLQIRSCGEPSRVSSTRPGGLYATSCSRQSPTWASPAAPIAPISPPSSGCPLWVSSGPRPNGNYGEGFRMLPGVGKPSPKRLPEGNILCGRTGAAGSRKAGGSLSQLVKSSLCRGTRSAITDRAVPVQTEDCGQTDRRLRRVRGGSTVAARFVRPAHAVRRPLGHAMRNRAGATLLDEGVYHCSIRTMYRLLDQNVADINYSMVDRGRAVRPAGPGASPISN